MKPFSVSYVTSRRYAVICRASWRCHLISKLVISLFILLSSSLFIVSTDSLLYQPSIEQSICDIFNSNNSSSPPLHYVPAATSDNYDYYNIDSTQQQLFGAPWRIGLPKNLSSLLPHWPLQHLPLPWMHERSSGVVQASNHSKIDMPPPKSLKQAALNPVIMIPGDGGSQLEARLNKSESVHYFCKLKTSDWFGLWLSLESLLPYSIDCFTDNMRFVYNDSSGEYYNIPGVETRVPGFGSTETIEWLDPRHVPPTHYFANIADYLIKANYTRNVTLRGTPYDFRKGPYQDSQWYDEFADLVEQTYEQNGQMKVVLLAHSMGNLHTWYMLKDRTQAWKDKYVECFISLSAPWTGAAKAIRVSISGDNLGIYTINALAVRPAQRTWPSLYALMPSPAAFEYNRTFVSIVDPLTKKVVKNYTLADMEGLFNDMEFPLAWPIYKQNGSPYWLTPNVPPGVKLYCLFGVGVPTEEHFVYTLNAFPNQQPIIGLGDGDGTVNRRSMEVCEQWKGVQKQPVDVQRFEGAGHLSILSSRAVIASIGKILGFLH